MDKYTVELYDWIATQDATFTKDVSFADFDKKISTDENYAKSMYNWISSIDNTFSSDVSEQDFIGRVKKKEDSQPVSVEESMVSTTEPQEELGSWESLFQPSVEELKADPNIQLAMQKGLILESDFEDYLKDLQFQGAPEMRKTGIVGEGRDPFFAKKLIETYKTRTKEDIRKEVEDLELDNKSPYRKSASGDDFVENVYSTLELARLGIDYKDFDGFLEENGYKEEFLKNEELGVHKNELTRDMNKSKYLNLYVNDITERSVAGQQLKRQYETGLHPDLMDENFSPQTGIDYQGLSGYRAKNMPALEEALIERQRSLQDKYKEALEQGDLNIMGETNFWRKAVDRPLGLLTLGLDVVGADGSAEKMRAAKERREFMDTPLHYATVSGKKVDIGDEKYIVSDDGQVYDVRRKINITSVAEQSLLKEITEKAKTSKERDRSISFIGMSIEGANVAGDLVGQIAVQSLMAKAAGRAPLKTGSNVLKTPISRDFAVAMVSQGTLGFAMGYEETLKQARAAGINEEKARELASSAAVEMGGLYAMTAIINPRTKAVNAVTGVGAKVKDAVNAYQATGAVGFKKALTTNAIEALKEIPKEGVKELVQENIQQAGEMYTVNPEINRQAGEKILKDTITIDEFITTSILSFAAGGLMPGAGSVSANITSAAAKKIGLFGDLDELQALDLLSKNRDQAESVINMHVKTGAYTQQQAKDLLSDIDAYSSTIESIPKDITSKQKKQAIQLINEIRKAEQAKAQLDPAFHENVDKQIAEKREQLKNITQQEEQEELFVTPTPDVVEEEVQEEEVQEEEVPEVEEVVEEVEKPKETVGDIINRPVTLTSLGGSQLDTPVQGDLYVDGQQVVVEDANGNIYEVGNFADIADTNVADLGIEYKTAQVTANADGTLNIGEKGYSIQEDLPTQGIVFDENGDVTEVSVKDSTGKPVMFKGQLAEEIAYQILLNKATSQEQRQRITELLDKDEEFQRILREAQEPTEETTDQDTEQATEPTAKTTTEEVVEEQEVTEETVEEEEDVVDQIDRLLRGDGDPVIGSMRPMSEINSNEVRQKIRYNIELVRKALSTLIPDIKVQGLGQERFFQETGRDDAEGIYYYDTKELFINIDTAKPSDVFHEAIHALLYSVTDTNNPFYDETVDRATEKMVESIKRFVDKKTLDRINEHTRLYYDNKKGHEFIAELGAILAEGYESFGSKARRIIRTWLETVAKKLGIVQGLTDNDVYNSLRAISIAISKGEDISKYDRSFIENLVKEEYKKNYLEDFFTNRTSYFTLTTGKTPEEGLIKKGFTQKEASNIVREYFRRNPDQLEAFASFKATTLSTSDNDAANKAVKKVRSALAKIAPNVKIATYNTRTAFIGMVEGKGDFSNKDKNGLYEAKTNTIHLDMSTIDAEVVYHEAFHAILRNVFGTDENIGQVTKEMAEALRRVLPSDIVSTLDEFIQGYNEGERNEEMVTILFGQMTDAYREIPKSRNIIKNFINRLAKLFGLKKFTDNEIVDVLNTVSGKMSSGEMILNDDISFLGVTGRITGDAISGKSALIGKIDLKRFPVNKNTKVFENTKLSELKNKLTSVMESDRMTGAYIPDTKGNPLYRFYGGLFYPIITGNMWSSGKKSKATTIAKNAMANRDEDGYVYMTPIIMKPGSHMSNQNMLNTVWEIMKHDLRSPTTRVTKARFTEYVEKALSLKNVNKSFEDFGIKKTDSVETIIEKLTPFMTQPSDKKTFQQRKAIVKSILGDPKVKEDRRFPSAGSFTEVASKFEEELTKGTNLWDFVVVYRTKGDLRVEQTDKSDPMHHDSYPFVIRTDAPVEVMILDKAYNVSQAIPGMKKSNGEELNFDEYAKHHEGKSDRYIVSQYGRTAKLSFAAGRIEASKTSPQFAVNKAKDAGFSDADIRKWGNSRGFTTLQINEAIKKYEEEKRFKGMQEEGLFNPKSNFLKRSLDKAYRKLLSARGFLGKSTQKDREAMNGVIEANIKNAITTINDLNKVLSKYKNQVEDIVNNLDSFLRGDQDVELPDDVREIAVRMRAHVDGLSKQLVEVGLSEIGTESYATIMSNIGSYLNRSYEVFDNPNYTPSDEIVTAAKNYLRNAMRGKAYEIAMQENNDPVTVLEEMVDREVEKILNKNLESDYKNAASKVGAKKTSLMDRRLEIPFEIRALMGEYTDPAANYARSVKNIVQLVESHRFTNKVRKAGEGIFLFDKPTGEHNVLIASEGSRSLDPLNGMYTTQEIYDALQNRPLISFDNKILNSAYEYWLKSVGTVKYSKTILSVGTHAKNVFGNLAFMLYNGYLNPSDYNNAYKIVKNDFLGQTSKEQRAKLDEYIKAGIISQSVTLQEIRSMFSGDDDFDVKLTKRHQDNGMTARIKRATKKGASKIADLYQAEDDFFKIVAYEAEKRRYAGAFHSKVYTDLDQDQKKEVDDYVAEIVKNILPNYSRIGQIREIIRAVPLVGTFISFEMEAWRTAYNTVKLASDELKDPRTRSIGRNRMLGIMSVSAAKALLYSSLGLFGSGDDEEEENSVVDSARQFMPPWAKNSNIVLREVGEGKFKYINVSASDPHGSLDEVLISFLRGDTIVESFTNAFNQFSSPFFSSDILAGAAIEILRNEDSVTGKPIYLETDNAIEVIEKVSARMWKAIEPGTLTSINKIYESETPFNEFTGQVSGLKAHEVEIGKQTFFRSRDISNRSRVVVRDYTSGKYRYKEGKIDRSELNALYTRANENHKEVYGDLLKLYEAGLKLGASKRDMVQSMKDGGVPMYVIRGIVSGRVPNLNR